MQAPSAQLRLDVCGAFDGLPLHADHTHDTAEDTEDPSMHCDYLLELGLLPDRPANCLLYSTDTQQTPLQQEETQPSQELSSLNPNDVSNLQQHSSPQLNSQPETGAFNLESFTDAEKRLEHKEAVCHVAHAAAADAVQAEIKGVKAQADLQCLQSSAPAQAQEKQLQPPSAFEMLAQAHDATEPTPTRQQYFHKTQAAPVGHQAVRQQDKGADPDPPVPQATGTSTTEG